MEDATHTNEEQKAARIAEALVEMMRDWGYGDYEDMITHWGEEHAADQELWPITPIARIRTLFGIDIRISRIEPRS